MKKRQPQILSNGEKSTSGQELSSLVIPSGKWIRLIINCTAIVVALLHLYAAFFPSAVNWGFHHLAFYPVALRVVLPFVMLLFIVPAVQQLVLRYLQRAVDIIRNLSRFHIVVMAILVLIMLVATLWAGRQRTFFLGDGPLSLRDLPLLKNTNQLPEFSRSAPLTGLMLWKLNQFFTDRQIEPSSLYTYQVLSILFGIGSLLILFRFAGTLGGDALDKTLVYLFIFVSGGTQLFFGYVENYTPTYFGLVLFLWLALLYFNSRVHLIVPSIAFGLLFTFHFGMIWLIPALGMLYYHAFCQRAWVSSLISLVATVAWIVLLLWLCGYTSETVYDIFFPKNGSYIVPIDTITTDKQAFTFFTRWHFFEIANLYILLSPFSLVSLIILTVKNIKQISLKNSLWICLLLVALCGFAFTFLINSEIGMSRDWDLFSCFALPIIISAAFAWISFLSEAGITRRLMVMMIVITALHSIVWISVNASEQRSSERYLMLPDKRVWGPGAISYSYEDLAVYYRNTGNYTKSIEFFMKCLEIEPGNGRLWANISDVYHLDHDAENELIALENAVRSGTRYFPAYINLGQRYKKQGRFDDALDVLKKGWSLDLKRPEIAFEIGTILGERKKDYAKALVYLLETCRLDPNFVPAYQNIGFCYQELGRVDEARYYWGKLLQLDPKNPAYKEIRKFMAGANQ